ncbi:MAG: DegQ family serine endoprotease [bacterium]|nr:DegQ family serine endoprotease [bacterium]
MRVPTAPRLPLAALAFLLLLALAAPAATAQMVDNQLRSYADVAEVASPAVVNVAAAKVVEMGNHPFTNDPFFRRFFEMPDDDNHRRNERVDRSLGSGVVISADGYILTNNHVVENAEQIKVTFQGEREFEAEIVGTDPRTDVALLKVDTDEALPYIRLGDSEALRVGDQVMAIGNPFGVGQTVTLGIASALGRSIGLIDYEDLIQTDASINPGNSGGALVNMRGELIGMNSAILSRSGSSAGVGFAIPSNMAMRIVESLRTDGAVARAYLGVFPQPVDQGLADYYGMDRPRGVIVAQVNDDTPAERAGLRDGDIILTVDGKEIPNPSTLRNVISLSGVGHEAELEILRDGAAKTVTVRLDALPDAEQVTQAAEGEDDEDASLEGVTVRPLTARLRAQAQLPEDMEGLMVMSVEATSNAGGAGLARGDVIQEVDRRQVTDLGEFQDAIAQDTGRPVFMRVYKPQQRRSVFIAVPR